MRINTAINQVKNDLIKVINESIQNGVPIICIGMILNELRSEVHMTTNQVLEQERQIEQQEKNKEGE